LNAPVFFFTAEDPREIPKGSRDPLRIIPIWSGITRKMIPYLTTVTPSCRGFLTRALLHGALETLRPQLAKASHEVQLASFSKFEQPCGIVRATSEPSARSYPVLQARQVEEPKTFLRLVKKHHTGWSNPRR